MKTHYLYQLFTTYLLLFAATFATDKAPETLGLEVCIQPTTTSSSKPLTRERLLEDWNMWECNKRDCPLSRRESTSSLTIPHLKKSRELFESFIIERIVHDNNPDTPLVYTSVGSGWLLQDYVIIEKLKQYGFKTFILNFIDPLYQAIKEGLSKNQSIPKLIYQIDNSHPYAQKLSYLRPFIAFKHLCGQESRVFFFDTTTAYRSACQKHQELKAHVLMSTDTVLCDANDTLLDSFLSLFTSATRGNSSFYILTYLHGKHASLFTGNKKYNTPLNVQHYYLCPSLPELRQQFGNDHTKMKAFDCACIQQNKITFKFKESITFNDFLSYSVKKSFYW